MSRYSFLGAAVLSLVFLLVSTGSATEFRSDRSVYIIDTVEINDDLLAAGQNLIVSGRIRGDCILGGMSATVDGVVDGSIMAAGSEIRLSGECRTSARLFGRGIDVDGRIERNLIAFGETIILGKNGWVENDFYGGANNITIQGRIGGDFDAYGAQVYLAGKVDGDVEIEGEDIIIEPTAIIGGDLTTVGENKPQIEPGAQILGETRHEFPEKDERSGYTFASFLFDSWWYLAMLLAGATLLIFFSPFTRDVITAAETQWAKALGLGFVFVVCLPIAAMILAVTIIGIPLAIIVLLGWLLLWYLSYAFTGLLVGEWVLRKLRRGRAPAKFWALVLGLLIILLLGKIPILGIILQFVIIFLGFGGFFLAAVRRQALPAATA